MIMQLMKLKLKPTMTKQKMKKLSYSSIFLERRDTNFYQKWQKNLRNDSYLKWRPVLHMKVQKSQHSSLLNKTKFEHQNNLFETINIHMLTIKDKSKNVQSKKKLKKSGIFICEDYCEKNWNCERLFGKSFCSIGSKTK